MSKYLPTIALTVIMLMSSCEKPKFENPLDPDTELGADEWAPSSLSIEILTDSDALLTWQKSEIEATGFKVERQDTTGGAFVEVGSSDTTIYTDTALLTGNEYLYQVCAYSGDNQSSYAISDTIVTTFPAPYEMSAVPQTDNKIELAWSDSTAYESGFVIERKNITSDAFTVLDSTAQNTYQDTTVTLGNEYVYKVGAYSQYNTSSYTDTALVKYWLDCLDVFGGDALEDECGVCNGDGIADGACDCDGNVEDCAGVCNGSAVEDCAGECGGEMELDQNGCCGESVYLLYWDDINYEWGKCYNIETTTTLSMARQMDWDYTEEIPSEIWELVNLTYLNIEFLNFTGSISSEIGNLTKLTSLRLVDMSLSGSIPSEIGNLTNLKKLYLDHNNLSGAIPPEIGNLTNLESLNLWYNQLTGEIPPEIGNLTNLTTLELDHNQLGCYEYDFSLGCCFEGCLDGNCDDGCLVHCDETEECDGKIPPELGNLTNLTTFNLHDNKLSGFVPPEICNAGEEPVMWRNKLCPPYPECIDLNNVYDNDTSDCPVQDCAGTWGGTNFDANNDGICDDYQGTVSDGDGNTYLTIKIGDQWWMAENLKVTHYNNSDEIPQTQSDSTWIDISIGAYTMSIYGTDGECLYSPIYTGINTCGDPLLNTEIYGNLYNWYAVDDIRGICPESWHVPSDEEWKVLEMYLGMSEEEANATDNRGTNEGSKLAGNVDLWFDSADKLINDNQFGSSGFNALPAGYCLNYSGNIFCDFMNGYADFWSSTGNISNEETWARRISYVYSGVSRYEVILTMGYSIRCLKD